MGTIGDPPPAGGGPVCPGSLPAHRQQLGSLAARGRNLGGTQSWATGEGGHCREPCACVTVQLDWPSMRSTRCLGRRRWVLPVPEPPHSCRLPHGHISRTPASMHGQAGRGADVRERALPG
jgi:hypothetical protein